MKKKLIIVKRNFIEENSCFFSVSCLKKKSWDNSIPKSVKSPVKWVVLTTEFEIFVTNEFCNPIANNNEQANKFGLLLIRKVPKIETESKMKLSINVGTT